MKKTYLTPNVLLCFPDVNEDILTLSNGGEGNGLQIGWGDSGLK